MVQLQPVIPFYAEEYEELALSGDRGFRFETYFTPGRGVASPQTQEDGFAALEKHTAYYAPEQCRLAQVYFYLSDYIHRPLDETALAQMTQYLQKLKAMGIRALLRFAYEYDVRFSQKKGPTTGMIRRHCLQLKQWFQDNEALVGETVFALQAGMVGAWGEWHNAQFPHSGKKVLACIADMAPDWMAIQVRTRPIRLKARELAAYPRFGYHDDYLVGVNFKWSAPRAAQGSPAYEDFLKTSRLTLNDGEMPWGADKVFDGGHIDGKQMIACCRERCLTTMSLAHNYRENGGSFNMERWKTEWITPQELTELGCSYRPEYFQDGQGNPVQKSVYDYLRDHLGYQLAVTELSLKETGEGAAHLEFTLHNAGFAQPHGFDELLVVVQNGACAEEIPVSGYRPLDLPGGASHRYTAELSVQKGSRVSLRFRNSRAPQSFLRLANRLPVEDGMALIAEIC